MPLSPHSPLTKSARMTYHIGRGEHLVLTFEPYKSELLPLWRFRTPAIAQKSSSDIWNKFLEYDKQDDFIGMDMARKYLQMGMTRAKRYANHKGGRKYDKSTGEELEKSKGHEGKEGKEEASRIFRECWERAREYEGYKRKKEMWVKEKKEWEREQKGIKREEGAEEESVEERVGKTRGGTRVEKEIKEEEDD